MRQMRKIGVVVTTLALALIVNIVADTPFAVAETIREATPIGETVATNISAFGAGASEYGANTLYDVKITLLSVIRGDKAWNLIQVANAFNKPPEAKLEYILARIRIACNSIGAPDIPYTVQPDNFKVYDTTNHAYEPPAVLAPEPALVGKVFHSGDVHEGWIPFLVAKDHNRPYIFYFGGLWFQLFESRNL